MLNSPAEFLRSRRSIRAFDQRPVDKALIRTIIETAAYAPSAHNTQPWRFVALTSDESKSRLAEEMTKEYESDLINDGFSEAEIKAKINRSHKRIKSAPVIIILCMDASEMRAYSDEARANAERTMAIQSTANAGTYLLLAAHAAGLGGLWTGGALFAPQAICKTFDLPSAWEPQAMFLLGYAVVAPETPERKSLEEVVKWK
jgi:coenzyme F420-0:L-glutamate ligase/coenzyme F420-1:gamma-L-glutamate ligase